MRKTRVLVAMSGGVDSSVTALLLRRAGYDVMGVFMRHGASDPKFQSQGKSKGCCSVEDALDARRVADQLDIPFYALNLEQEFERIIDYFVDEYNRGRTPNPCVQCNRHIKFGTLLDYADKLGADYVATGHYARIEPRNGRHCLLKGVDGDKDQAYVLATLTQRQLKRTLLPLGGLPKSLTRRLAEEHGLKVFSKKDSQDICFVPGGDYRAVLRERNPSRLKPGTFVTPEGRQVGEHDGYQLFTVGQRKGLGVALGKPVYVKEIRPESNTVVLGEEHDIARDTLTASALNWVSLDESEIYDGLLVRAQIRYNHESVDAQLFWNNAEKSSVEVRFATPERAVTPGQAVVFYHDDTVVGSGWID